MKMKGNCDMEKEELYKRFFELYTQLDEEDQEEVYNLFQYGGLQRPQEVYPRAFASASVTKVGLFPAHLSLS